MNFEEMTVAELRKVADDAGVAYAKRSTKDQLINKLEKAMTEAKMSKRDLAEAAFLEAVKDPDVTRVGVIDRMIAASECSKNLATTLYPMFCQIHNITATSDRGAGKIAAFKVFREMIDPENPPDDLQEARKQAFEKAKEESGLTDASLQAHMRNYLKMHGFELTGRPTARASVEERTALIKKGLDANKERKDIIQDLIDEFGYTENSAAGVYQSTIKSMGLASDRGGSEKREAAWKWFKDHLDAKRGEAFVAWAEMDISAAMAQSYWSTFNLAVELAEDLTGEKFREEPKAEEETEDKAEAA